MARSSGGRSALSRAVGLIESFDVGVRDLSLTEMARRADMPLTTAHRVAAELVSLGLLERLPDGGYRIGLRLWELAVRTPGALGIREIAQPHLLRIQDTVRQHAQLSVLQDGTVLYLDRLSAPDAVVNLTTVGGRMPYSSTSSGLVLVAHADEATRSRLLETPVTRHERAPTPDATAMSEQLRRVRAQGFAVTRDYIRAGATAIAVPVLDPLGAALAALAVVVPTDPTREQALIGLLLGVARDLATDVRRMYAGTLAEPRR